MDSVVLTSYDLIVIGFISVLLVCVLAAGVCLMISLMRHRRWNHLSVRRRPDERNWQARDVREREMIRRS